MNTTPEMNASKPSQRKRKSYPPTERGVRVRAYPNSEKEQALIARCRVRAIIWNWCCDVFDRARARSKGEDETYGLSIQCTRKEMCEEIERLRRNPNHHEADVTPTHMTPEADMEPRGSTRRRL